MKRSSYRKALLGACFLFLASGAVESATITVTSTADAGGTCPGTDCTLRQAIAAAASGDTITFSLPAKSTITLTSAELLINKDLTINGPGPNLLSVQRSTASGTAQFRIFNIPSAGVNLTVSGLTIANGLVTSDHGGAFLNVGGGALTIANSAISGNSAAAGLVAAEGGAIYNYGGLLILTDSTVSGNSASSGGGILNDGGTVTVNSSTIFGNSASIGGGIYNPTGTATVSDSTISGNTASVSGGGMANDFGTFKVQNTIIALNTAPTGPDVENTITSQGYNLIGNNSDATITPTTGDQIGKPFARIDPLLDSLKDNGGPTKTRALLPGSPAIEGGNAGGYYTDQRGFARPVDSPVIPNATGGDGSDIGAYEVQADQLPGCNNINTIVNNQNDSGTDSLRDVIANVCAGSTITFAPSVRGAITLTSAELLINKALTVNGPGANLLSVQRSASAGNFSIFNIAGNFHAAISGLTISNGNSGLFGGAIVNSATLTLASAAISGNSALSGGGGIQNSGTLAITNSTISANSAPGAGGISNSGTLTLANSTISGNSATSGNGGGIAGGTVTINNSTISGNSATGSGGGFFNNGFNGATVTARNTIMALNTAASGPDFSGALSSDGFNLIGDSSGAIITPGPFPDQVGVTAEELNLGPLQNNGGPTMTHALLADSRAIDKGHSGGSTNDQRGFIRPIDLPEVANASGGDGSDIGAFEFSSSLPPPLPSPTSLANISTRLRVEKGDNALIGGFIVTGTQLKKVIIRGIGPSLPVAGKLADPSLELYDGAGKLITSNDNWMDAPNKQEIIDSTVPPTNALESAILTSLAPGAYTAIVRGNNATTGVGQVEVYDLDQTVDSKLANISTRGLVQTGDNVMIGGFIAVGTEPLQVIVRAIGPSLTVPGKLADPILELYDGNGALLVSNDNWRSDQEAEIIATTVPPTDDLESAIVRTLAPAAYTVIVRGVNNTTGVALVEAYALN